MLLIRSLSAPYPLVPYTTIHTLPTSSLISQQAPTDTLLSSRNCMSAQQQQQQVPKPYFYPVYKNVPVPVPKAVHKIVPVIKEKPVIVKKKVPIL